MVLKIIIQHPRQQEEDGGEGGAPPPNTQPTGLRGDSGRIIFYRVGANIWTSFHWISVVTLDFLCVLFAHYYSQWRLDRYIKMYICNVPCIPSQIMSRPSRSSASPETSSTAARSTETCAICCQTFSNSKLFLTHLSLQHFKDQLQKKLIVRPPDSYRCPSCKIFLSSDLDTVINHYGALCLPIPVKVILTLYIQTEFRIYYLALDNLQE